MPKFSARNAIDRTCSYMYVRFIIHTHTHTRGQTDTDRQQARSNDSLDRLVDRQMTQKEGSIDRLFVPVRYVLYRKESMGKLRRYISSSSSLPSCPSSFLLLWVLCVVLFLCHAQEEQGKSVLLLLWKRFFPKHATTREKTIRYRGTACFLTLFAFFSHCLFPCRLFCFT